MLGGLLGGVLCIELEELELEELELEELIGVLLALGVFVVCCAMRNGEQEERIATANQDSRIGASR
jgi:hypothetical protein